MLVSVVIFSSPPLALVLDSIDIFSICSWSRLANGGLVLSHLGFSPHDCIKILCLVPGFRLSFFFVHHFQLIALARLVHGGLVHVSLLLFRLFVRCCTVSIFYQHLLFFSPCSCVVFHLFFGSVFLGVGLCRVALP